MRALTLAALACGGADPAPPDDTASTGPAPTGAPTGSTAATAAPTGDTGPPPDTAATPPPVRGTFVDVTGDRFVQDPLWLHPGDPTTERNATTTGGWHVALTPGGPRQFVFVGHRQDAPEGAAVRHLGVAVEDAAVGAVVPSPALDALPGPLVALAHLDDDAWIDAVVVDPETPLLRGGAEGWTPFDVDAPLPLPLAGQALTVHDVDEDGWLDLVVGDRGCGEDARTWRVLLRSGPTTFTSITPRLPAGPASLPWAILVLPTAQGPWLGAWGKACSFADPPTGFLAPAGRATDGYPIWTAADPTPAAGPLRGQPSIAGGPTTLVDLMGAAVFDLDADRDLDLVVSNDHFHVPIWTDLPGPSWDDASWLPRAPVPTARETFTWTPVPIDLDRDGLPDLVATHGDDSVRDPRFGTFPQPVLAWWNKPGGTFRDTTAAVGLPLDGNWRALTPVDLDDDGDLDLIGGGFGTQPRVWRNALTPDRHTLTLELRGSTSNHYGLGALVEVIDPDVPQVRRIVGEVSAPTLWAPPILELGLGDDAVADLVRITWPSGWVQELTGLAGGQRHVIEEPELVRLSVPGRHLPADGTSTLQISVFPRDATGASDPDAEVAITLAHGTGTFLGPTVDQGVVHRRVLRAPAARGSAVIGVTIDGIPLRVRPRVWWDGADGR